MGNPGRRYDETRHNLGFAILDRLAQRLGVRWRDGGSLYDIADADRVRLIKPKTFVNRSGLAAVDIMRRYEITPRELFVISDDFHLALGRLRLRPSGSAGGHRGLESIIAELGTVDFPRLRAGIGPLPEAAAGDSDRIREFVLTPFTADEKPIIEDMISRAAEAVEKSLSDGLDAAIALYNSNPTPEQ
jgi:peptidyl-tRNA hydrolase, PTH1 family